MKTDRRAAARTLFAAAAIWGAACVTAQAEAPTTYVMNCRGGGDMGLQLTWSAEYNSYELKVRVRAASQTLENAPLPLGTCSWPDRTLNDDEPRILSMRQRNSGGLSVRCRATECEPSGVPGEFLELMVYAQSSARFDVMAASLGDVFYVSEVLDR